MTKIKSLSYKSLRQTLPSSQLHFETTEEINSSIKFIGQTRALEALSFGIHIKHKGYNLYAMGPSGIGKYSFVKHFLQMFTRKQNTPCDWCYLYNFDSPEKPIALELPTGQGFLLQQDMKILIEEISSSIIAVLESDEYQNGISKINRHFVRCSNNLEKTDKTTVRCKKQHDKTKQLEIKLISAAIKPLFQRIKKKYSKIKLLQEYFIAAEKDVITHSTDFISQDEKNNLWTVALDNPVLVKYKINLLVDNRNQQGAPIIFEDSPNYSNLICRIEHTSELGSLTTNFTLIRPGSLHRANGGYLIIEARKLKKNSKAWEALKSCLYAKQIKIKSNEHEGDSVKPISLDPMPIPLSIKIILLGDRNTYYSLCQHDSEFIELFKVPVDFDEEINRTKKNIQIYAQLIATICKNENLRPFHASAVAAIIDYSSRLAEDNEKLSTHLLDIENIILESDYWSSIDKQNPHALRQKQIVKAIHVKNAIQAQNHRMDRAKELYFEEIYRDFILIKTTGKVVGQINCLSVRRVGNFSYGHPTRVTARVRLGHGKLIDIQREIKMAGPLHTKAGLIIANFIASRFNPDKMFSLTASISFEQLYCWTDGDSASVGELCALLSALANVPINQNLAVTGSIDQYGEVQVVGGLNDKIEGFFDICQKRGLTGNQGVLIPTANIKNLMLKEEVVKATKEQRFFIYPIDHIDQAVELMMNLPSGKINKYGKYSAQSIYQKIETRLKKFSQNRVIKTSKSS